MIQLPNNKNMIITDENEKLLYITNRRAVVSSLPSELQNVENSHVSHIIPCFASHCFILIFYKMAKFCESYVSVNFLPTTKSDNICFFSMYGTKPLRLQQSIDMGSIIQDEIGIIRASSLSKFIAVSGKHNHKIQIINAIKPDDIQATITTKHNIKDIEFWSDENGIYVLTDHNLLSYSLQTLKFDEVLSTESNIKCKDIVSIKAYPGGKFIISISENSIKINVWNIDQKTSARSYQLPDIPVKVMFDSTGLYVVAACKDNNIYFIDWFSGQCIYKVM